MITPTFTAALLAILFCALAPRLRANDNRAPNVGTNYVLNPPGDTNKVHFHAYATGWQIYVCAEGGTPEAPTFSWVFNRPLAALSDAEGNQVGAHFLTNVVDLNYTGPAWEMFSGSYVVGKRLAGVSMPNTIPWLLLQGVTNSGPGVLEGTTYIQRVNTVGGPAPTTGCDADHLGQEAWVPYTAEYYFYRGK